MADWASRWVNDKGAPEEARILTLASLLEAEQWLARAELQAELLYRAGEQDAELDVEDVLEQVETARELLAEEYREKVEGGKDEPPFANVCTESGEFPFIRTRAGKKLHLRSSDVRGRRPTKATGISNCGTKGEIVWLRLDDREEICSRCAWVGGETVGDDPR